MEYNEGVVQPMLSTYDIPTEHDGAGLARTTIH
jgi:hypothetical protein